MKLDFIPIDRLSVSKTNMRFAKRPPDVGDILPTVRARGVLVPLIVRPSGLPTGDETRFEIVAGARRYRAAQIVADERRAEAASPDPDADDLPCAILDEGDDADAVEASMIENLARRDPDEVSQWESFVQLLREGRKVEEIATTFGLPERMVRQVLALGNLLPRIRQAYREDEIDRATARHLTLATKSQQKDWLALLDSDDTYAPTGHQLKAWLFGGQAICAKAALFDIEASGLATVADLFGEDRMIADADAFWTHQYAAIEVRREAYLEAGWSDVVIVPATEPFSAWEHEKAPKRKGGRVYIDITPRGEVAFHEGYVTCAEARRIAKGERPEAVAEVARPEMSGPLTNYVDLHRHAAVRAALLDAPGVALRLMVAHLIAGSSLWTVKTEPQSARNDSIAESVETCRAESLFDAARRAVLARLDLDPERPTLVESSVQEEPLIGIFLRLLDLDDAAVLAIASVAMGETLAAGSVATEAAGAVLNVRMADWWEADDAFFDLIRDKEVAARIVADVAPAPVAVANAGEKVKTLKKIARDYLAGADGRPACARWAPRWMAFPPSAYTARGGVGPVQRAAIVAAAQGPAEPPDPDSGPETPGPDAPAPDALAPVPTGAADSETITVLAA